MPDTLTVQVGAADPVVLSLAPPDSVALTWRPWHSRCGGYVRFPSGRAPDWSAAEGVDWSVMPDEWQAEIEYWTDGPAAAAEVLEAAATTAGSTVTLDSTAPLLGPSVPLPAACSLLAWSVGGRQRGTALHGLRLWLRVLHVPAAGASLSLLASGSDTRDGLRSAWLGAVSAADGVVRRVSSDLYPGATYTTALETLTTAEAHELLGGLRAPQAVPADAAVTPSVGPQPVGAAVRLASGVGLWHVDIAWRVG